MPDLPKDGLKSRAFAASLDTLLSSLAKSAKTAALYKEGHATSLQIAERAVDVLLKTLGEGTTLTLEVKGKSFIHEEQELPSSPEASVLAASLHTLGIGQLLFTNRVTREGMTQFFKLILLKPDGKATLSDLQKIAQQTRIDGLQLTFLQDFVVTGEAEIAEQIPGQFTEEQVQAFVRARTLPDFLTLLLRQNEVLRGKEVEVVDSLLASVLDRDAGVEALEAGMPWSRYDPRIRERLQALALEARAGERRTRDGLLSWASVFTREDLAALHGHRVHEKYEVVRWSVQRLHGLLARPANAHQPKFSVAVYGRMLRELGRDAKIDDILTEFERWEGMAKDAALTPHMAALKAGIEESLVCPVFAAAAAAKTADLSAHHPDFERLTALLAYLGEGMTPLLLDGLALVQDKAHRANLCALITGVCGKSGTKPLLAALKHEDYFLVVNVVSILATIGGEAHGAKLAPLLKHSHPKVRESVWRALAKSSDPIVNAAMLAYIAEAPPEETAKVVIAMSLTPREGLDAGFIAACRKTPHEQTQVAIITALGRFHGAATITFLKEQVRRTWYEVLTGRRKALSAAGKSSLEALRKDGAL